MISFYHEDCDQRWDLVAASRGWRYERCGFLHRIRYAKTSVDSGVAVVTGRPMWPTGFRYVGAGSVADGLHDAFWALARLLPGQGFQEALRAMPQNTHPSEETLPAAATEQ